MSSLPSSFITRKSRILADLAHPNAEYSDNSPKGSIDVQIRDLINEINAYDGLVTTSSCAGRVSVFVEGAKGHDDVTVADGTAGTTAAAVAPSGGKGGGGRWTFVSHESIDLRGAGGDGCYLTDLFGMVSTISGPRSQDDSNVLNHDDSHLTPPRLVRLAFEPLILHVLCASLYHAKPLLAAAISSGFRESGVQSLKNLEDVDACPMVGIRTLGVGFETVVGYVGTWDKGEGGAKMLCAMVEEEYLRMMVGVVNARFVENERRKDRLRVELKRQIALVQRVDGSGDGLGTVADGWENKEMRRARKRREGLDRQKGKSTRNLLKQDKEVNVSDLAGLLPD